MQLQHWKTQDIQPAINEFEAAIIHRNNRIAVEKKFLRRNYLLNCNLRDQLMIDELRKELKNRKK